MTVIPNLDVASIGLIKDVPAANVPAAGWTQANNIRFVNKSARRAPGFRLFLNNLLTTSPYSFYGALIKSASDYILYTDVLGKVYRYKTTGAHGNVSAPGHVDTTLTAAASYTMIGENCVICRQDEQPWYLVPDAANFVAMPGWNSAHQARAVRTYRDFVVAINITKSGTSYPVMVKTSSPSFDGAMPTSWNHTDPSTLATENSLAFLQQELIDGLSLGDDFILYTASEAVIMSYTASDDVFAYRPSGISGGILSTNCVTEVARRHYVFGLNDLYMHEGSAPLSIANERVKDFVFKHLDRNKADRAFVAHDERLKTVWFCFVSSDAEAYWGNTTHCNRAAGYNYENNTWSFIDIPNACGAWFANPSTVKTWATIAGTWSDISGSWGSYGESALRIPVFAANPPASGVGQVLCHDVMGDEAYVPDLALQTQYTAPAILQKTMVDFGDLGVGLKDYKTIKRLYPQIDCDGNFQIRFGSQMTVKEAIVWSAYQTFVPGTDEFADTMTGGKLVSFELKTTDTSSDFTLTAYDTEISIVSKR